MIVDYNYKPYVYNVPIGTTQYFPPSKNNKGFIVLVGRTNASSDIVYPYVTFYNPSGTLSGVTLGDNFSVEFPSGSFFDLYLQSKREATAATTGVIKSADIAMVNFENGGAAQFVGISPIFMPITYQKMQFLPTTGSWLRQLIIITLY